MGIVVSLIAQLLLKPISIDQPLGGNYTVRSGNEVIWIVAPGGYYTAVGLFLAGALFLAWYLQKRLTVGTGLTLDKIEHGVARDNLVAFVEQIDSSLKKLDKYGYQVHSYPPEDGSFVRGVRLSDEEEDSITVKIQPFVATFEAHLETRSLEAVKEVMRCFRDELSKEKQVQVRTF